MILLLFLQEKSHQSIIKVSFYLFFYQIFHAVFESFVLQFTHVRQLPAESHQVDHLVGRGNCFLWLLCTIVTSLLSCLEGDCDR